MGGKFLRKEKIMKIVGLNVGIAVIDTILFSPGFLGIQLQLGGTSILSTAFGATAIFMSVLVFILGNYKLFIGKEKIIQTKEIKTVEDCINALKQNYDKKTFELAIDSILEQIERFQRKKETIDEILLQKFDIAEMSYSKFHGVILDIEKVFYLNIKSILNKLNAFDEEDYNRICRNNGQKEFSVEFIQTKMDIYKEYISYVKKSIEDNEEILLKLDKFLLEISKFNSLENGEIEKMGEIKEVVTA